MQTLYAHERFYEHSHNEQNLSWTEEAWFVVSCLALALFLGGLVRALRS